MIHIIFLVNIYRNNIIEQKNEGLAKYQPNFDKVDNYFVYSDIIEESQIGNVKANLLRVVSKENSFFEDVNIYTFNNLMFVPLRINEINSIKISITDNFGQIINYKNGYIYLKLLFRNDENVYFE